MKQARAFISIVVTAILALSLLPAQALADDPPVIPTTSVTTGQAESIGSDSVAITLSEYEAGPIENISEFGVEIATEQDFSDAIRHIGIGSGSLFFISGLVPETTYYYRSYMLDEDDNEYYGDEESFDTPAEAAVGTVRDSRRTILTEIAYMNALIEPFGVNAGELADLPEKEVGFYEELARYANISDQEGLLDFGSMPTQTTSSSQTASYSSYSTQSQSITNVVAQKDEYDLFGERFEYACYIADLNMGRDPDASTYEDEVVYMYLSHYIDMIPADVGTTVDYNSNSRKFSAWITEYDREVYDSYLRVSQAGVVADKMRATAAGIASLGNSTSDLATAAKSLTKSASVLQIAATTASAVLTEEEAEGVGVAIDSLIEGLNEDKTPQEVIEGVYEGLDGHNYESETQDFIISTATSIALGVAFGTLAVAPPIGILIGAAIFTVNFCSMAYMDLYQYVAWLAMGQSLSGRIPGRMLRYYGLW
jgi:hypothetical protein